ncbi:MAG: cyclase family protein [Oscillospiraceae bacterium]|nr:cyclase family protein [Oscillospiraceae bacterium]
MIIDISQEVFSCQVYPGDPAPEKQRLLSVADGDPCNLTALSMCAHNGTHVDAPFHFINDGKTVDQIPLSVFAGPAYLTRQSGNLSAGNAEEICIRAAGANAMDRILIAGDAVVTAEAAAVFAQRNIRLLGVESQSVGPLHAPAEVHRILLGAEVVLLEGIRLGQLEDGRYFLCCAPLNLAGCDGAPCRAFLISE